MISKSEVDNLETLVLFLYLHAFFQHTSSIHIATTPDGPVDSFCIAWYRIVKMEGLLKTMAVGAGGAVVVALGVVRRERGNIYKNIGLVCVMSTVP